mgnify:CR=1 FL=1
MTEAAKAPLPLREADATQPARFGSVRSIYDALYRGEIDEGEVVELLTELRERDYSWPSRVMAMISRQ